MPQTTSRRRAGLTALVVLTLAAAGASPALGAEKRVTRDGKTYTATPLTGPHLRGAKSPSGRLAQSDPALLRSTSATPTPVVVKLDYDSLAAYAGGVEGLPATSPAVTGKPLDPRGDAATRYGTYTADVEREFVAALKARFPAAEVGRSLRTVYGGVAVELPARDAKALLGLPGVAAVQADALRKRLTDSSPAFIGAPAVYPALGGDAVAGKGVIVGVLDSGAWPEHPSYADPGTLPAPPPTKDGAPRACTFGDNPLTPAADPFACNKKLVSGRVFLDTYNANNGGEMYPASARDSDGHGTHTSTTAAGGKVAAAQVLGVNRGTLHGIAPGAAVAMYKVCGTLGCYSSDSAAAVQRAVLDGVKVINFSISGGTDPYADPVELAFLDAYAAGVFVAASAGNDGPGAGTANHVSPWVTTVAASTQSREFRSTVSLQSTDGSTATVTGASLTAGAPTAMRVVLASAPPYNDPLCSTPAPPGIFAGRIVVCQRGGGVDRVLKGFHVKQGGAAGMLLHNTTETDVETDNHWLPTVHLASGTALLAFVAAHPGVTATFTAGAEATGQGDVMASFSSRGPAGDWLKPDVTAPGVQILAGETPTPETVSSGPAGNYYKAIAGTSMAAPHVAGAAALLFALNPGWTPGQVKSALQTTARRAVVKEDGVTPADAFDMGSGRIDLAAAANPGLTFDETAATYAALGADAAGRPDANLPSVNVPTMPGAVAVTRVAKNVTSKKLKYTVKATAPSGVTIAVVPSSFDVAAGATKRLTIAIAAPGAPNGRYLGRIELTEAGKKLTAHLPVAFEKKQGAVTATQDCAPATIARQATSTCTVSVHNTAGTPATVTAATHLGSEVRVASVTGATRITHQDVAARATLAGRTQDSPTIAPGASPAGYIPLDAFGIAPTPVGDEEAVNLDVPPFQYAGRTYTRIGVTSNGYSLAGGATGNQDVVFEPQTLPDPARPNAVMAPYWTDLDGTGAPGILAATLTDGVSTWIVLEWRLNLFGTDDRKTFQQWIGVNGVEDVSFTYDPANLPGAPPASYGLTVGAESADGSGGAQITGTPTQDLVVRSTPGSPGGTLTYTIGALGHKAGVAEVTTGVITPAVRGITTLTNRITVQ